MCALLDPLQSSDWDKTKARHLLNRAGFGVPVSDVDRLEKLGVVSAVAELIEYEKNPETQPEPDWLEPPRAARDLARQMASLERLNMEGREMTEAVMENTGEQKKRLVNMLRGEEKQDIERLKQWWFQRMLRTKRPLQEKMTLFWHGHFATSADKVKSGYHNYQINKLFRDRATGNFKLLAYEVGITPAMLRYLDNAQNYKGHPNENWARELMELFTLGKGNYTEEDIKNSSRAWTGWSSDGEEFAYRADQHDSGEKTFLGQTGNFNGNDIIDIIFRQDAAAEFITRKLWSYFAYDQPEEEIVKGLAKTLRAGGYELKPMLKEMFRSQAFYSGKAMGTQVKSPAQLAVSMLAALNIEPAPGSMVELYVVNALRMMGQDLFYPPNVKGWDGGRAWINTNSLMVRYNLSNFLVQGVATSLGNKAGIERMLLRQKRVLTTAGRRPSKADRARRQMAEQMAESGDEMMMAEPGMEMEAGMGREMAKMDMRNAGVVGDSMGPKGLKLPFSPFDAEAFFQRANKVPVGRVAEHLADYFYGRPLQDAQRAQVYDALAGGTDPNAPFDAKSWDIGRLRGAVRLMLSTAEYQIC